MTKIDKRQEIMVYELPEIDDVITKQYFSNCLEIRSNMTGLTGSGKLLVSAEIVGTDDPTVKKVETLYNKFLELPTVKSGQ